MEQQKEELRMNKEVEIGEALYDAIEKVQPLNHLDVVSTAEYLANEFPDHGSAIIENAIDRGAMGKYGSTDRLTANIIGSWVYKFLK
jgi:hypothetical protein